MYLYYIRHVFKMKECGKKKRGGQPRELSY